MRFGYQLDTISRKYANIVFGRAIMDGSKGSPRNAVAAGGPVPHASWRCASGCVVGRVSARFRAYFNRTSTWWIRPSNLNGRRSK